MSTGKSANTFIAQRRRQKELEAENERLRELLGMDGPQTYETFGAFAPQAARDQAAAAALIYERLNYEFALKRLGFKVEHDERGRITKETKALGERVFGTPGVQAILANTVKTEIEPNYSAYVQRLNRIAFGDDDKQSNMAIQSLARLGGLNKEKPAVIDARTQNLFLVGQQAATKAALQGAVELQSDDFLTHEPGEPERIFEVEEG